MKPQSGAVNVLERTSNYLKSGVLKTQPVWLSAVGNNPPTKNFLKEPKKLKNEQTFKLQKDDLPKINNSIYNTKSRLGKKNTFKIPKLKFVEDELRDVFYKQHPWELSRPKILLENSGDDAAHQDWSRLIQTNKQLDGESVIQRTLYLLKATEPKLTLKEAYDQSRYEFYRLRIEQEIEEQISKEENIMFGASFEETPIEHGINKEQKVINKWKEDAIELTSIIEANRSGPSNP
ncbi:hypothetical protein WICMUC_005186 [Wickerhamomyces mucosus]|uniref:37S ribosomal protein S25, mitochondrial n=1 Tax=Wickerhamomyces mucosus TaxID=1378264 RepID=A0A9P8T6B2_9ASCO|nr:hypothetical protein WICMUC_005186 [Wickerhamomyces mucosus]